MHLGNTRLNTVKWVSFKQDDSAPLKCSCNCNWGDHTIYDTTENSQRVKRVPLVRMPRQLVQTGTVPSKQGRIIKISPSGVPKTSQTKESFG